MRENNYVVTLHADEEMDEDKLSMYDVERAILTGSIIDRQKDTQLGEWKYLVRGQTIQGDEIVVVVKIGPTCKMLIITVFRD